MTRKYVKFLFFSYQQLDTVAFLLNHHATEGRCATILCMSLEWQHEYQMESLINHRSLYSVIYLYNKSLFSLKFLTNFSVVRYNFVFLVDC